MTSKEETFKVALTGDALLAHPRWNKVSLTRISRNRLTYYQGTAFTEEERRDFKLRGRLPYEVNSIDQQIQRVYHQLGQRETPIRKNSFLQSLK